MSAKRRKNSHRELLFCKTQPVVGGWMTSSVILQLDFKEDASVNAWVEAQAKKAGVGEPAGASQREAAAPEDSGRIDSGQLSDPVWTDDEAPWPKGLEALAEEKEA